jgi:hypothetical protein
MITASNTTTKPTAPALFAELDYRENDGIEISLLWNRSTNSISVLLVDTKTNESFEATVASEHALDAFKHPYTYVDRT